MNNLPDKRLRKLHMILASALFGMAFSLLCIPTPASADVTLKQINEGKGLGMSAHVSSTTRIRGDKMRIDDALGKKTQTTIFDLDAQKAYFFDSKTKRADVWNMRALAQTISKSVDTSSMKASIKPNGQTKSIAGHMADGYDVRVSVQAVTPGSHGLMTVTLNGSLWVVKHAPGTADFDRFYKSAAEKGWIFSNPRAAKAQPAQARAMTEMYQKIAELGGIPYETDLQIHVSAGGLMGALLSRLGKVRSSTIVESVQTKALTDELFAPPPGYEQNLKH